MEGRKAGKKEGRKEGRERMYFSMIYIYFYSD